MRDLLLSLLCGTAALLAQSPYGRITGRITDATGAFVSGAPVTVSNLATNVPTAAATSAAGVFDVPNLAPGQYRITVQVSGFKSHERGPLEVRVGDVVSVEIALELGSVSESIQVEAGRMP